MFIKFCVTVSFTVQCLLSPWLFMCQGISLSDNEKAVIESLLSFSITLLTYFLENQFLFLNIFKAIVPYIKS